MNIPLGNQIDVVLKLAERCNLACPYCYYFFQENKLSEISRPLIPEKTVHAVAAFLRKGALELNIKHIYLGLHGGEPTLLPKQRFDRLCTILREALDDVTELHLGMQTNGTLIDEEWIALFAKHQVMVGVSIDGPKDVHDQSRPDRRGRGSYDNTVRGLRLLQAASADNRIPPTGVLCVANASLDGREVMRHFAEELNVTGLNLLLPRQGHGDATLAPQAQWTRYFGEIIDYWMNSAQKKPIKVYMISEIMKAMMSEDNAQRLDFRRANRHNVITISAEGYLGPDDNIMALDDAFCRSDVTIENTSLREFFASPMWRSLVGDVDAAPEKCADCEWFRTCRSGDLFNRYKSGEGFSSPSVFCETLDAIHAVLAKIVVSRDGLEPVARILSGPPQYQAAQFMNPADAVHANA